MKKMKKLAALLLACVMVLSMSVSVFAAGTVHKAGAGETAGNLKINCADTGATITAYQVLEWDDAESGWKLTDWAKTALTAKGAAPTDALAAFTTSGNSDSSTIAGYLTILAEYVNASGSAVSASASATVADPSAATVLNTTQLGSYLVICKSADTSTNPYVYTNMLVSNYDSGAEDGDSKGVGEAEAKGVPQTIIDKKEIVNPSNDSYVAIGDVVQYKVTINFPYFQGYDQPTFAITDNLNGVMELVADTNGTPITTGADEVITNTGVLKFDGWNGTGEQALTENSYTLKKTTEGFRVDFKQDWLKKLGTTMNGAQFTMSYFAKITGYTADNALTNTVSGTVNTGSGEKQIPDVTETVYTVGLKLIKKDANNNEVLTGAEFVLMCEGSYLMADANKKYTGTSTDISNAYILKADNDYTILGLDPDKAYTIVEKTAPQGYQKNADANINFTASTTEGEAGKYTVTKSVSYLAVQDTVQAIPEVTVLDTKMGALPGTGGVGIIVVSLIAVIAMVGFGGAFIYLKKRGQSK